MMHWWCTDDAWVSCFIFLSPLLFKNIVHDWSFQHLMFVFVFFCLQVDRWIDEPNIISAYMHNVCIHTLPNSPCNLLYLCLCLCICHILSSFWLYIKWGVWSGLDLDFLAPKAAGVKGTLRGPCGPKNTGLFGSVLNGLFIHWSRWTTYFWIPVSFGSRDFSATIRFEKDKIALDFGI